MLEKIISGGQTGVDLAALDFAITSNIPYGGWCPKGRINEKGIIPKQYQLEEIAGEFKTEQDNYDKRTKTNIEHSDGTVIFISKLSLLSTIKDGTKLTINEVEVKKKPLLKIDLSESTSENIQRLIHWIKEEKINILNVAGPRESISPGIYQEVYQFLNAFLLYIECSSALGMLPRYLL